MGDHFKPLTAFPKKDGYNWSGALQVVIRQSFLGLFCVMLIFFKYFESFCFVFACIHRHLRVFQGFLIFWKLTKILKTIHQAPLNLRGVWRWSRVSAKIRYAQKRGLSGPGGFNWKGLSVVNLLVIFSTS